MSQSRRNFIAIAIASTTGVAVAQPKPIPGASSSPGATLDRWAGLIQPQVATLNPTEQAALLKRNGVTNFQELSLTLAQRYPALQPGLKPKDLKLKFLGGNPLADQGTYEKSPSFDKEPYDKSPGYDRGGFDRSYELTTDFKKLVLPSQNAKTK